MRSHVRAVAVTAGLVTVGMTAAPAEAGTGCNGVVNIFVWGCAPWDNNNGPQFPYHRKKQIDLRVPAGAKVHVKDGSAVVEFNGQKYPVVGGAGVVSAGGANVVSAGGANVVSAGGANMKVWVQN
jgi:hypothetical protein